MLRVLEYNNDIRSILKKVYALILIVMIQLRHICPNVTSADKTIVVACYKLVAWFGNFCHVTTIG